MSMDRRQFLSRFFKGLAVAAIAPEVIAKACEEHQICSGKTYSLAKDAKFLPMRYRELLLPPHFEVPEDRYFIYANDDLKRCIKECGEGGPGLTKQTYDEVRALQAGKVDNFVGYDFIRTELVDLKAKRWSKSIEYIKGDVVTYDDHWQKLCDYFMPKEADLSL